MVFQSYALFPHLSVAENVVFGLKVRKVGAAERREKLGRALEITGLLGYERRKPGELSGGQRQRVALARRSQETTSELQSLMRTSYAVFCLKKTSQRPKHTILPSQP